MSKRLSTRQVWGAPVLLGALSALGLASALFSDAAGDWFAWLSLGIPVAIVTCYSRPKASD